MRFMGSWASGMWRDRKESGIWGPGPGAPECQAGTSPCFSHGSPRLEGSGEASSGEGDGWGSLRSPPAPSFTLPLSLM